MLVPTPFLDFFIKSNILQSSSMTVSVCFGHNVDLIQRFRVAQNCVLEEESRAWIIGVPAAKKMLNET